MSDRLRRIPFSTQSRVARLALWNDPIVSPRVSSFTGIGAPSTMQGGANCASGQYYARLLEPEINLDPVELVILPGNTESIFRALADRCARCGGITECILARKRGFRW